MKTRAEIVTKRFVRCTRGCEHLFEVEHLFANLSVRAGPWACDVCGHTFFWEVSDGVLHVTEHSVRHYKDRVVLELVPQKGPVRFTIKSTRTNEPNLTPEAAQYHRRYYEEHTHPLSWIDQVEKITVGEKNEDTNLFDLFRYVRSYDGDKDPERPLHFAAERTRVSLLMTGDREAACGEDVHADDLRVTYGEVTCPECRSEIRRTRFVPIRQADPKEWASS